MSKIPIYLMPGMAASPAIFDGLHFPEKYDVHYLEWIIPFDDEPLTAYTNRIIKQQIKEENPILLGVSFGGIIVQEIAKQIRVRKLILISTIKTHKEFQSFYKNAKKFKLYRFFPSKLMHHIDFLEKIAFTKRLKKRMKMYKKYMFVDNPKYLDWSLRAILNWEQDTYLGNFVHIQGEKDRVFPVKNILDPKIIIKGGRHTMILTKARWFNKYLPELLSS